MIDLYTAMKLTNLLQSNEIVCLRRKGQTSRSEYKFLSVNCIKNKYDMRKTKVIEIYPYFFCGEYNGLLFTIKDDNK